MITADFAIRDEGTIVLFLALTDAAKEWWEENCQGGMNARGIAHADHRCAQPIVEGIADAGFEIERI